MDRNGAEALLTPKRAAEFLGASVSWLAKLRVNGEGPPYVKLGGKHVRYRRIDLNAWIDANIRSSTSSNRC